MIPTIPIFKRSYTADFQTRQIEDNIEAAIGGLLRKEIISGALKKDVLITTGRDNTIDHPLDREPRGWIIVKKNANADIWESSTSNPFAVRNIILKSSATVTATFWFF